MSSCDVFAFEGGVRRTAEWEREAGAARAGPTAEDYAREDAAAALTR